MFGDRNWNEKSMLVHSSINLWISSYKASSPIKRSLLFSNFFSLASGLHYTRDVNNRFWFRLQSTDRTDVHVSPIRPNFFLIFYLPFHVMQPAEFEWFYVLLTIEWSSRTGNCLTNTRWCSFFQFFLLFFRCRAELVKFEDVKKEISVKQMENCSSNVDTKSSLPGRVVDESNCLRFEKLDSCCSWDGATECFKFHPQTSLRSPSYSHFSSFERREEMYMNLRLRLPLVGFLHSFGILRSARWVSFLKHSSRCLSAFPLVFVKFINRNLSTREPSIRQSAFVTQSLSCVP